MKIQLNLENKENSKGMGLWALLKLGLIAFLTLILLIPSAWIERIITERQDRKEEVVKEIADKWSNTQLVEGPIMILPYKTFYTQKDSLGKIHSGETVMNIYLLPETLKVNAKIDPQILHRGIFDGVVYNSRIQMSGKFPKLECMKSGINPSQVLWDKVKVDFGISDLRGIDNTPQLNLNGKFYPVETDLSSLKLLTNNLVSVSDLSSKKETDIVFKMDLNLKGSEDLEFSQVGKNTEVGIEGNWGSPSFTGRILPETRSLTKEHFKAFWKMPYFGRPYPQQWVGENTSLKSFLKENQREGILGVKLLMPIDQYQEITRTAKYSVLIILLSFLALFFTELLNNTPVHVLQYVLIGFSLVIFYMLLLSLSEHLGFNWAYLISASATITLIGIFVTTLLKKKPAGLLFSGILTFFYGFVFVIIQLEDLALLFGSIALFLIVAAMMFLSTQIIYKKEDPKEGELVA